MIALDLLLPADDRIQFAFFSHAGQVDSELVHQGGLALACLPWRTARQHLAGERFWDCSDEGVCELSSSTRRV